MESHAQLKSKLRYGLVPAVPVTFRSDRTIHESAHRQYVEYLGSQPIAGVAVWAHTGRGLHITAEQRDYVLNAWRAALPGKIIIAGVGGDLNAASDDAFIASALNMGEQAAKGGADAMLVYAPTRYRNLPRPEAARRIVAYHEQLATLGIPLVLFYLYEDAGGISYSPEVLTELAGIPQVMGMKIATAFNVIAYQDIVTAFKSSAPDKLIITGEDRFLGYSLMCGAESALIGMGSALTGLQKAMMDAYFHETGKSARPYHIATDPFSSQTFLQLSRQVDLLSFTTFAQPLQGYIQRMLWVLVEQGIIPGEGACDPWGPELDGADHATVKRLVGMLNC